MHRIYWPELIAPTPDEEVVAAACTAAAPAGTPTLTITGSEAHHAANVKRLAAGEPVEVFDGQGLVATGRVAGVSKRALAVVLERVDRLPRPRPSIVVAAPTPKGPRAELMIEQLSQAGAARWIPLITQRCVSDPREAKVDKWRAATVVEAAKQCGRAWLLEIDDPKPLSALLEDRTRASRQAGTVGGAGEERMVFWMADTGAPPVRTSLLAENKFAVEECLILVGPEGGLTDEEKAAARAAGATPVRLGPHVYRLETAALIAAGLAANLIVR